MGSAQKCIFCRRNRHIIIFFLLLLVSSSTQLIFMAEGARSLSGKLTEATPIVEGNEAGAVVVNARRIGSRPPRCDRRCSGCGHCEAVQVPVAPQAQRHSKLRSHRSSSFSAASSRKSTKSVAYSRGDDITNYKPMSWKCKCGNLLFNP